jgi:Family of unknown function (DUF5995)
VIGDRFTLNQVRTRIAKLLDNWEARRDQRARYLTLYSLAMDGVHDAMCRDAFADPLWVLQLVSHLADHYFITVTPDDDDRALVTAPAWQAAHACLQPAGRRCATECVALGLNALLSNDLPQAIAITMREDWPVSPSRMARRAGDLRLLAGLLAEAASCAQEALAGPRVAHGDALTQVTVDAWCDDAWATGLSLCTAVNATWWTALCEEIECTALRRAHLLVCDIDAQPGLIQAPAARLNSEFPVSHEFPHCRLSVPAPRWGTREPVLFPER